MNKFLGVGCIGSLPEPITNGCKLSVCLKTWDGVKEKNVWIRVLVFGKSANSCLEYLEVGRRVSIDGRVDLTVNGNFVIVTDNVQFL